MLVCVPTLSANYNDRPISLIQADKSQRRLRTSLKYMSRTNQAVNLLAD